MKFYVTFGWVHEHKIGGKVFDKDCVAVYDADDYDSGRKKAFDVFGDKFCFVYSEDEWEEYQLNFFPRGYVDLEVPYDEQNDENIDMDI